MTAGIFVYLIRCLVLAYSLLFFCLSLINTFYSLVMSIISWMLFGLIVGIVANAIDPDPNKSGLLGAILLGIVGALVGGFLSNLLFGASINGFNLTSFLVAVGGSLVLLFTGRAIRSA